MTLLALLAVQVAAAAAEPELDREKPSRHVLVGPAACVDRPSSPDHVSAGSEAYLQLARTQREVSTALSLGTLDSTLVSELTSELDSGSLRPVAAQARVARSVASILDLEWQVGRSEELASDPSAPAFSQQVTRLGALLSQETVRVGSLSGMSIAAQRQRQVVVESACLASELVLFLSQSRRSNTVHQSALQLSGPVLGSSLEILTEAGGSHPWLGAAVRATEQGADPVTAVRVGAGEAALAALRTYGPDDFSRDDVIELQHRVDALVWTAQAEGVSKAWRGRAALLADEVYQASVEHEVRRRASGGAGAAPELFEYVDSDAVARSRVDILSFAVGESSHCHSVDGEASLPEIRWSPIPGGARGDEYVEGAAAQEASEAAVRLFAWSATMDADSPLHMIGGPLGPVLALDSVRGEAVLCDLAQRQDLPESVAASLAAAERQFFKGEYEAASRFAYAAYRNAEFLGGDRPKSEWWSGQFGELSAAYMNREFDPADVASRTALGSAALADQAELPLLDEKQFQEWLATDGNDWYQGLGPSLPERESVRSTQTPPRYGGSVLVASGLPTQLSPTVAPEVAFARHWRRASVGVGFRSGLSRFDVQGLQHTAWFLSGQAVASYRLAGDRTKWSLSPGVGVGALRRVAARDGTTSADAAPLLVGRVTVDRRVGERVWLVAAPEVFGAPLEEGGWATAGSLALGVSVGIGR